jgi:hypothetical protein
MPSAWRPAKRSPRKTQANRAIWNSTVLWIMLDSIAERVRSVRFHNVNAKAVFTTASQRMITQWVNVEWGQPLHGQSADQQHRRADAHARDGDCQRLQMAAAVHVPSKDGG